MVKKLKALERLEDSFSKLPSIGRRSAEKIAFSMLFMEDDDLNEFSSAVKELKEKIHFCPICGSLTENDYCDICSDDSRDKTTILVVSNAKDVITIENTEEYNGLYHVLGGNIGLSRGKSIDELNIPSLIERVKKGDIKEMIIATNPTIEGETTALYLAKLFEPANINITRLAYGLPMGSNLDYADTLTLAKAIEGRRKL